MPRSIEVCTTYNKKYYDIIAKDMIKNCHNTEILENNNIEDINSKLVIDFAQKKDKLSEIIINDVL